MSAPDSLGIIAAFVHNGSSTRIHAVPDRPAERATMRAGRMGWFGYTLCGLRGLPCEGRPFVRPLNHVDGLRFADYMAGEKGASAPCPKCRAEFNRREKAAS